MSTPDAGPTPGGPEVGGPVGERVLVLGGGGVTGIAWELGVLTGLAEAGVDLTDADTVLGTSAGSVVGAQVTSGSPLRELYERQLAGFGRETKAAIGLGMRLRYAGVMLRGKDGFARRMGALATRARTPMSEADRLAVIAERLPEHHWPDRDLRLCVVDAATGEFGVLTRRPGVALVAAVAASAAVPGVYPPITVGDRRYVDGGVRSVTNADLAAGARRVIVLAPAPQGIGPMTGATEQVAALQAGGAQVALVVPDEAAVAAIGRNVLDPAARAPAARAGLAQAAAAVDAVSAVWR